LINIVDIVGMELMNNTLISESCKALSKSINHINILQIEMSLFNYELIDDKRNGISTFISSLPDSSQIAIRDSEFVGLYGGNMGLGKISFRNIKS
jgi:hypothetical protein